MKALWLIAIISIGGSIMASEAVAPKHKAHISPKVSHIDINGIAVPLIFEKSALLPAGSVQLVFLGGAADSSIAGLGALSARILNEGTKSLGSTAFAKQLESKAIGLSASIGLQTLSFNLSFLKEFQNDAFSYMRELLYEPNLSQVAFDKVKSLMLNKLAREEDDFDSVAKRALDKLLFKDTPMAVPLNGTKQSVESIALGDIEAFLAQNIALKRLMIVAGGDMDENALKEALKALLSNIPEGESKAKLHFKANKNAESITIDKPTQQAFVYFGAPFDNADSSSNYMARVMSFILGGSGFGSRIMEEVRVKRGLAYSAYLRISTGGAVDYASGYLQTKLESKDEAISVIKEVIAEFIDNGVTQDELDAAKAFLLGSEPLSQETLSQRLSATFANYFRDLPLDNNKQELAKIKTLDLETLNNYIKSHKEILNLSFSVVE